MYITRAGEAISSCILHEPYVLIYKVLRDVQANGCVLAARVVQQLQLRLALS